MKEIAISQLAELNQKLSVIEFDNDSLMGGNLGLIIYHYQRYKVYGEEKDRKKGIQLVRTNI